MHLLAGRAIPIVSICNDLLNYCVFISCHLDSSGTMIPSDVQGPGMLVDLPAVAQRREQEDLPLYRLPSARVVSKSSSHMGTVSSRYGNAAWYGVLPLSSSFENCCWVTQSIVFPFIIIKLSHKGICFIVSSSYTCDFLLYSHFPPADPPLCSLSPIAGSWFGFCFWTMWNFSVIFRKYRRIL